MQRSSFRRQQQMEAVDFRLDAVRALDRVPAMWAGRVREEFERLFDESPRAARDYAVQIGEECAGFVLPASANDGDVRSKATELVESLWALVCAQGVSDVGATYRTCRRYVERFGLDVPPTPTGELSEVCGAVARMLDAGWWRRQLRKRHGRAVERAAIRLGYVHLRAGKYCSDNAVQVRQEQKRRNAEALAGVTLENQFGDALTLASLAERSNANPRIRRAELMTRISGFEAVARGLGHKAIFLTLTCPSRFHAIKAATGEINPAWGGGLMATPRDAQEHLNECWQKMRAALARRGVRMYGFRIAEPHHDGCPHWHVLMFVDEAGEGMVGDLARRYFWRDHDADEAGAAENRVKVLPIPMTGTSSAAGYIAKYVAKNIDGYKVQQDLFGGCAVEGAARVDAWAARWGVRQFQQIGGAPVGVWRELRRIKEAPVDLDGAVMAADLGAWAEYVKLQGGPTVKRADLAVVLEKSGDRLVFDPVEGAQVAQKPGRYGEAKGCVVYGVRSAASGVVAVSRAYRWRRVAEKVQQGERVAAKAAANARQQEAQARRDAFGVCWAGLKGLDFGFARPQAAQPWSRVNNCTGGSDAIGAEVGGEGDSGRIWGGFPTLVGAVFDDDRANRSARREGGG